MLWSAWFSSLATAVAVVTAKPAASHPEAFPGTTVTFDYKTEAYLYPGQKSGGIAYVTDGAPRGAYVPLVVFLHGLNKINTVHMWFNGEPGDLRPLMNSLVRGHKTAPFVFAAPSQTKAATSPRTLFPEFDLEGFVSAVDRSLGGRVRVQRRQVVLVGHSGGGCNPNGGIVSAASQGRIVPDAVLAVDTCLDADIATAFLAAAPSTRVWVYWQRTTWPRQYEEFRRMLESAPSGIGPKDRHCEEVMGLVNAPHDDILPAVLEHALPDALPPATL